jgi:hypothetical protein
MKYLCSRSPHLSAPKNQFPAQKFPKKIPPDLTSETRRQKNNTFISQAFANLELRAERRLSSSVINPASSLPDHMTHLPQILSGAHHLITICMNL